MIEQVGRYRVQGTLGKGAMGVVLLAEDPLLHRKVAIKTLDFSQDDAARRELLRGHLLRDARAAASLTHAHIVAIYDVVEEGDSVYLVLEYVAGESLAQRLAAGPPPDTTLILRVLREMASALDYTHARGIIHRDIKPANVMLDAQGASKITDFGIARLTDSRTGTLTGTVMGTLEYMAPEQVKGEPVDARADQFSLAAVAYEMLTGSTLFREHSFTTLAYKIVHEMHPPARTHKPDLPPAIDQVLNRALRKTPADRYPSCGTFVDMLERAFSGGIPETEAATQTIVIPGGAPKKKGPRVAGLWIAAAVGTAAIALAAAVVYFKPAPAPTTPQSREIGTVEAPPAPPVAAEPSKTGPAPPKVDPPPRVAKSVSPPPAQTAQPAAEPEDSPAELEAADSSAPEAARGAYNHGKSLFQSGDYPSAIESFTRAIQLKPDMGPAYTGRAQAYLRQDKVDEAVKDLSEAIRRNPRHALAYSVRGNVYLRQNKDDLAMADFTRSIELAPMAVGLTGRGTVYLHRGEYQKAIADFTAAISKQPGYSPAYRLRRQAELAIGDRKGARGDFQKARGLNGKKAGRD